MSEENKETTTDDRKEIQVSGFSDTIVPLVEQDLNLSVNCESDSLGMLHSALSST